MDTTSSNIEEQVCQGLDHECPSRPAASIGGNIKEASLKQHLQPRERRGDKASSDNMKPLHSMPHSPGSHGPGVLPIPPPPPPGWNPFGPADFHPPPPDYAAAGTMGKDQKDSIAGAAAFLENLIDKEALQLDIKKILQDVQLGASGHKHP
eukprot:jgi/Bigna1/132954/aug1.19_g7662